MLAQRLFDCCFSTHANNDYFDVLSWQMYHFFALVSLTFTQQSDFFLHHLTIGLLAMTVCMAHYYFCLFYAFQTLNRAAECI